MDFQNLLAECVAAVKAEAHVIEGKFVAYAQSEEPRFAAMVTHEEAIALHALAKLAKSLPAIQAEIDRIANELDAKGTPTPPAPPVA